MDIEMLSHLSSISDTVLGIKVIEQCKDYTEVNVGGESYFISKRRPTNKAMVTDFYQLLTMCFYLMTNQHEKRATFQGFFRQNPFNPYGYTIALGIGDIVEYLEGLCFTGYDIDWIKKSYSFPSKFLEYLKDGFSIKGCMVEAVEDGTMVQPNEPLVQITGPLAVVNFIETFILNTLNYQSMFCTKASRITHVSKNGWFEFALRRSPGREAALMAAKAAYVGGAVLTSNVEASMKFDIPIGGSMPHSSVMCYGIENEIKAFEDQFEVWSENTKLLIDTYSIEQGIKSAVSAAQNKQRPIKMVRIDSRINDSYNEVELVRKILDENSCNDTKILLSGSLDESDIVTMNVIDVKYDSIAVGEKLIEVGNLGMVYKLVEIDGAPVMKFSSNKHSYPGRVKIFRFLNNGNHMYEFDLKMLTNENILDVYNGQEFYMDNIKRVLTLDECKYFIITPLLREICKDGVFVGDRFGYNRLSTIRDRVLIEMNRLSDDMKTDVQKIDDVCMDPYPVYISKELNSVISVLIERYHSIIERNEKQAIYL